MMISPDCYMDQYRDKSYAELLPIREELYKEILSFENKTYDPRMEMYHPSPEVVYQCNLEYLGKLCELISQKYNQEFVWEEDEPDE